jgi:hypothetical protein
MEAGIATRREIARIESPVPRFLRSILYPSDISLSDGRFYKIPFAVISINPFYSSYVKIPAS